MRNLKFPEIEKKMQQSVYGAWGGSSSNEPTYWGGELGVTVTGGGHGWGSDSFGSGGDRDYDYGPDYGGGHSGSGGGDFFGDNFIDSNNMLVFAQGLANSQDHEVEDKIRSAVNATGLAAGFTGSAMSGLEAITKEIGFTVKTFGKATTGIGAVSVVIGGHEVYIAAQEAMSGKDPWDQLDSLNLVSTILGGAALIPGPHSIICGGLSIAIGLVGTAYSQN